MRLALAGAAQTRWRAVNALHLVTLVPVPGRCERSKLVERDTRVTEEAA